MRRLKERQERDAWERLDANTRRIAELEALLRQERTQRDAVRQRLEQLTAEKEALELDNREIRLHLDEREIKDLRMRKTAIYVWFHTPEHWDAIRAQERRMCTIRDLVLQLLQAFLDMAHRLDTSFRLMGLRYQHRPTSSG